METRWGRFLGFSRLFLQKEHWRDGAVNFTGKYVKMSRSATSLKRWLKKSEKEKQKKATLWPELFSMSSGIWNQLRTGGNTTAFRSVLPERRPVQAHLHYHFTKMTLKNKPIQFDIPSSYLYGVVLKKLCL